MKARSDVEIVACCEEDPAVRETVAKRGRIQVTHTDYRTMLREGMTTGDVVAATIVAADIKSTPEAIVAEAKSNRENVVDVANAHGMHAWPLEIFLGLVYLDYTDDPTKELHRVDNGKGPQETLTQIGL